MHSHSCKCSADECYGCYVCKPCAVVCQICVRAFSQDRRLAHCGRGALARNAPLRPLICKPAAAAACDCAPFEPWPQLGKNLFPVLRIHWHAGWCQVGQFARLIGLTDGLDVRYTEIYLKIRHALMEDESGTQCMDGGVKDVPTAVSEEVTRSALRNIRMEMRRDAELLDGLGNTALSGGLQQLFSAGQIVPIEAVRDRALRVRISACPVRGEV